MALDVLPGELILRTRDEWRDAFLRSYKLHNPAADIGPDTAPYIDACVFADQAIVLTENQRRISHGIALGEMSSQQLDQRAADLGMTPRFPATGSSGYVIANTSLAGATIFSGDELTDDTGLRYQCLLTKLYANGENIPVAAIDTGPQTNLAGGKKLVWSSPRPGCVPTAIIVTQPDGSGLTGGCEQESDVELALRISDTIANPPASGNDAAYQTFAQDSRGHGVAVQKAFTWPAANGPGTTALAFTLKPATVGASRRPNATQMQLVRDYVAGKVPADDQLFMVTLLQQSVNVVLDVQWASGAADWTDAARWPPRYNVGGTPGAITVSAATTATSFTLASTNYTGIAQPVVGQTIAFYDQANGVFRRKKILSFTGTGPWVITVDTSNQASDTTYVPVVGQRACPWSDSLNSLVTPILTYFGTLGPGEQFATFFDPGYRQKRSPASPRFWPYVVSNRLAGDLLDPKQAPNIQDAVIREGLGTVATIGTPGTTAYLIELGFISAFPL